MLIANEPQSLEQSDRMLDLKGFSAVALRAGSWANDGWRERTWQGRLTAWVGGKESRRSGGLGPKVGRMDGAGASMEEGHNVQGRLGQAEFEKPGDGPGEDGKDAGEDRRACVVGPEARVSLGEG